MTEPDAGSDVFALSSTAELVGDHFMINGQKMFCSGANIEGTVICMYLRTDPDLPKHKGISMILVDNDLEGLEITPIKTLAGNMIPACQIFMNDVKVPKDRLVGKLNQGASVVMSGLNFERLFTCAGYVGLARTVVDDAIQYAKKREQFGRPIGSFQAIGHMLADMHTELDAARLLTYRAGWLYDQGLPSRREISMAKLYASEFLNRATNQGMQIMGGYGYCMENDMQRFFREARIRTVSAGSSQIQRTIIARELTGLRVM
jgi:alkylation response protein AidB-like acyl-CoA dehydrogenase